jgi:hypothetical protein
MLCIAHNKALLFAQATKCPCMSVLLSVYAPSFVSDLIFVLCGIESTWLTLCDLHSAESRAAESVSKSKRSGGTSLSM